MDEDIDVEGEEDYEEYTWAGQTRIRATSMLHGGVAGWHANNIKSVF